jgi:hypothetical protein
MILDATETVLGYFGFDRTAYSDFKKQGRRKWWYEELREERTKDIETKMMKKQVFKPFSSFLLCLSEPSSYELVDYLYFEIAFHILCISY